jgi:hypothetical protein
MSADDCVALLGVPNTIVKWKHTDEYPVSTLVSSATLLRATDPLLILSLTDVTAWVWARPSQAPRPKPRP